VIVLAGVLVFSTMGLGLLTQAQYHAVATARRIEAAQAFWASEGGVHQALCHLDRIPAYRFSPSPLGGTVLDHSYNVDVAKSADTFTITSTATSTAWSRTLELTVEFVDIVTAGATTEVMNVSNWGER
jgi:Tfp pilus assembly protein PilX